MSHSNSSRDFHHPYQPYDIQNDFMNAVYNCLEAGKVGIFESPTGTGKSLSLICGSLTWLREHKRRNFEDGLSVGPNANDEPSWMVEHAQEQRRQEALRRRQELNDRLAQIKAKEGKSKERYNSSEPHYKKQKLAPADSSAHKDLHRDEATFALEDYDSDGDQNMVASGSAFGETGLSSKTKALMAKLGYSVDASSSENEEAQDDTKIFFCSRTHSQLTQFSSELNRVQMPPALNRDCHNNLEIGGVVEDVKHLTLGSRRNLCINDKVSRLENATAINEACVELQQASSPSGRCPHMPAKDDDGALIEFRDHALAKIRDIEDLGKLGKRLGICPYYASRPAVQFCEIITLPYPLLLQKSARDALGLSLKNHVVIIDEAHNLMDAITGNYSVSVTLEQLQRARSQLTAYLQKFRNKLKGKNRIYVAQTVRILDALIGYLATVDTDAKATSGVVDMLSIMSGKGLDQINVFKLNTYLHESRLARKVDGYTAYSEIKEKFGVHGAIKGKSDNGPRHEVPVLMHMQSFLQSLTNPSAEGRFFYSKEDSPSVSLKYMLLDPTFHFKDIVEEARAVVLAGGTMSPMSDYKQHLLSYLEPSQIMTIACGHVIPPSNLLAIPVVTSSSGTEFNFTLDHRNEENTQIDLGHALCLMARNIPDGMVVFFPSYAYLDACIAAWKRLHMPASKATIWDHLDQVKPIFLEERNQKHSRIPTEFKKEAAVNSILTAYSAAVASNKGRGALLFAVVGGTLSEGINFSDALGRGVVVIGLPFPNSHSAEWKAKLEYVAAKEVQSGGDGKAAARDFLENACMRAVNQCIGRAIRHRGDYAAILMLDRRYGTKRIRDKLPGWIRDSLHNESEVMDMTRAIKGFFSEKA